MNKKILAKVAEEVLTDLEGDLKKQLRRNLEREICRGLYKIFDNADSYLLEDDLRIQSHYKKSYDAVKPVLDDVIDKLLVK